MKKLLLIFIGVAIFLMTASASYAGEVTKWKTTVLDAYVQKGVYSSTMTKAFYTWAAASNRRFLFNVSTTKSMQKIANIKFVFNQVNFDGIIENRKIGINMPQITFNIVIKDKMNQDEINAKCLHFVGIAMGLNPSGNIASVMYKEPLKGQTILIEDVENLYALYEWPIPKRGLIKTRKISKLY